MGIIEVNQNGNKTMDKIITKGCVLPNLKLRQQLDGVLPSVKAKLRVQLKQDFKKSMTARLMQNISEILYRLEFRADVNFS